MKHFLLRLWSIFFYLLFGCFFALIFPLHFLLLLSSHVWAHDVSHFLNRLWGFVIMYPTGLWVTWEGRRQLQRGQPYLFTPNHTSYLDIPICNVSIHRSFRFMGKAELNSLPLFGYMFKRLHVSVNRGSVTDSFKSFKLAQRKLEEGRSLLIFPEATIPDKKSVTLKKFKDGAFRMAIETGVPIVPVTILRADKALPDDGRLIIHPQGIRVVFHTPIATTGMTVADAPALRDRVYQLIFDTLVTQGEGRGDHQPDTDQKTNA
jgi:1-acyl-sn-glycerol-3-phosphate acyltransferase